VDVVKRPTGGGALLHGWDISFSVTDVKEMWGKSPKKIYLRLMGLLKENLERLGLSLGFSNYGGSYGEYFCIFQPTFGEIKYRGRIITFEELSVSWEELLKAVKDFFTRVMLCKASYSL
jgi:Lipoate-protein ligase A